MSDDGYYPGSPYDDADEVYYDEDVGENLADDLAEHTLPSPIYHEDPAYEMLEYYSDWEYYSDDYYDDDPVLLNDNPQIGSPIKRKAKTDKPQGRSKKRKIADNKDIPELELDDRPALASTVRGTVWAGPKPQSPKPYEVGQGKKIALLKDWKQIFERSSPRSMLKRDESWANDLSLEDMGLRKVDSHPARESSGPAHDQRESDMEDDEGDEEMDGTLDGMDGATEKREMDGEISMDDDELRETEPPKRKRLSESIPSPPPSHNSSDTSTKTMIENMTNTSMTNGGVEIPSISSRGRSKKVYPNLAQHEEQEATENTVKIRKRKASPDIELADSVTSKSTASNRAKRVASSRLATAKEEKPPPLPTNTRATRSRKK